MAIEQDELDLLRADDDGMPSHCDSLTDPDGEDEENYGTGGIA